MEIGTGSAPLSPSSLPFMTCVEDRADPNPTQSPAFSTFADTANHSTRPMLQYAKKGRSGQSLRLSQTTYEQLTKGKSVEFYNKHGMGHMVIRLRRVAVPI